MLGSKHAHAPRWGDVFPLTAWFDVRELAPGVHLISEPGHVNSFLIEGSRSAVLLDTGLGVANIRKVAEELTPKPLLAVNSHYHFDHTGGNQLFTEIAIHRLGADLVARDVPQEVTDGYMSYTRRMLEAWGPYKQADDLYYHLLTVERLLRPLPGDFDPAKYRLPASTPSRLLDDGDVLDLGDRKLQVLHTPGHSPDCICLFDEENGLLFGGDTINTGPIYAQLDDSDLGKFASSTARLADMSDAIRRVFVCHFMRYDGDAALLREIADGFRRLLAGDVVFRDNIDCLDFPVREACFDHFSVFVPPLQTGAKV
jgi:glyoxylase-like metal-dependent hydrolase (beta-lactamase superfamily II)